jgi:hypothetical protein
VHHTCPCIGPRAQSAYNWALAAYFHHGKDHPETKAALAATKAADPHALVPRLLAGLAYPALCMAPGYASGSSMEAVVSAPARHYQAGALQPC